MPRFPPASITEEQVMAALDHASGNQRRAAVFLGVNQSWVTKFLKRRGYVALVKWVKQDTTHSA